MQLFTSGYSLIKLIWWLTKLVTIDFLWHLRNQYSWLPKFASARCRASGYCILKEQRKEQHGNTQNGWTLPLTILRLTRCLQHCERQRHPSVIRITRTAIGNCAPTRLLPPNWRGQQYKSTILYYSVQGREALRSTIARTPLPFAVLQITCETNNNN